MIKFPNSQRRAREGRRKLLRTSVLAGAGLAAATLTQPAQAQSGSATPPPAAAAPVACPVDLIGRAAASLGPSRARSAAARLRAEQSGTYFAGEQARSPAEPIAEAERTYRWWHDAEGVRALRDAELLYPGEVRFSTRSAISAEGGWTIDRIGWRTGTDLGTTEAKEALRTTLQWQRSFPHLLLMQAARANECRSGSAGNGFQYVDAAGDTIEVLLDPASGRPARAKQIGGAPPEIEWIYSDYRRRHGVMLPMRQQLMVAGRMQEDLRLGRTSIGRPPQSAFNRPKGYSPPPPAGAPGASELAPGVLFFQNLPANYHSMAVDVGDHLVLIEAPLNPAYAAAQRRLLDELRPGKKVRYVLVTHHHGDHNGGLASWAEAGATIVVPAGGRIAIERQLRARGYSGPVSIEEVQGRRSFGSGASQVDTYAFSTSHAESHLLMHLPAHRILFQGDLFYLPERGPPPPAFPLVRELPQLIDRFGLAVDTIVGVHGRPGTMADLRESLRRGR